MNKRIDQIMLCLAIMATLAALGSAAYFAKPVRAQAASANDPLVVYGCVQKTIKRCKSCSSSADEGAVQEICEIYAQTTNTHYVVSTVSTMDGASTSLAKEER